MTETTTATATDPATATRELVDRYIAIWNETDPERRRALIAATWAADGTYVDPLLEGTGHAGIEAMTVGVQGTYPGATFVRSGAIDAHHDRIRFGWQLNAAGGETMVIGTDFAVLSPDGTLQAVTGFFEPV